MKCCCIGLILLCFQQPAGLMGDKANNEERESAKEIKNFRCIKSGFLLLVFCLKDESSVERAVLHNNIVVHFLYLRLIFSIK